MSIQDDYWDVQDALKNDKDDSKTFEHFAQWAFNLEEENNKLIKRNQELKIAIKAMMGI